MVDLIWLSDKQMERISPHFPRAHGIPRVDDRKTLSGIIFVIKNGARWRDVPREYGYPKTIYNWFIRWSKLRYSTKYSLNSLLRSKNQSRS